MDIDDLLTRLVAEQGAEFVNIHVDLSKGETVVTLIVSYKDRSRASTLARGRSVEEAMEKALSEPITFNMGGR